MARVTRSKAAVRLNVARLLGKSGWGYLWTLTTPDQVELPELAKRWNGFRRWFERVGFRCVRVFEPHPGGHGWHVHFVTGERLGVRGMRVKAEAAGFGRINVKRIAKQWAGYLAKYVGKKFGDGRRPRGARMWACVGFKGSSAKNVVIKRRTLWGHWTGDHWELKPWPPHLDQTRWGRDADGRMILQHIWIRPPMSRELQEEMDAFPLGTWSERVLLKWGWIKLDPPGCASLWSPKRELRGGMALVAPSRGESQ
jgi:hypothetical protein